MSERPTVIEIVERMRQCAADKNRRDFYMLSWQEVEEIVSYFDDNNSFASIFARPAPGQ